MSNMTSAIARPHRRTCRNNAGRNDAEAACVGVGLAHISDMVTFLTVLTGLAMLGTLGVLVAGMVGLARGDGNPARSNVLMRWRVVLQGIALMLFIALVSLLRH
ncbi:MAG: twin transmembrane helix small protein [Janthinobacterium lividum]